MDRHERPYKCNEPGCEVSLGFTYSGGLLRHQREVHKMHLTSRELLYCPFQNCVRASGNGFTRKENLEEHKRRRHQDEIPHLAQSPAFAGANGQYNGQASRKRKRLITPQPEPVDYQDEDDDGDNDAEDSEGSPLIKRLRSELVQKDALIRGQAMEINRLMNLIRSLPPQAIYGVNTNLMSMPGQPHTRGSMG